MYIFAVNHASNFAQHVFVVDIKLYLRLVLLTSITTIEVLYLYCPYQNLCLLIHCSYHLHFLDMHQVEMCKAGEIFESFVNTCCFF